MKNVKVGQILAGQWGYSMTLYNFYEVTSVTPKTVVLRELAKTGHGSQMHYVVKPLAETYENRVFRTKNDPTQDFLWDKQCRALLYPYDPNKEYAEDHMD